MARVKKKVTFNPFDANSIANAVKEIEKFGDEHDGRVETFLRKLALNGVDMAKAHVQMYNAVFTAEMLNSIHVERKDVGCYLIVSDSEHSAFVEFGTGQLGQEGSYPYKFPDGLNWQYNIGDKIFEFAKGQYGWFYVNANGETCFTQGMPSRPFMTETALELESVVSKVAREVFNGN